MIKELRKTGTKNKQQDWYMATVENKEGLIVDIPVLFNHVASFAVLESSVSKTILQEGGIEPSDFTRAVEGCCNGSI